MSLPFAVTEFKLSIHKLLTTYLSGGGAMHTDEIWDKQQFGAETVVKERIKVQGIS